MSGLIPWNDAAGLRREGHVARSRGTSVGRRSDGGSALAEDRAGNNCHWVTAPSRRACGRPPWHSLGRRRRSSSCSPTPWLVLGVAIDAVLLVAAFFYQPVGT